MPLRSSGYYSTGPSPVSRGSPVLVGGGPSGRRTQGRRGPFLVAVGRPIGTYQPAGQRSPRRSAPSARPAVSRLSPAGKQPPSPGQPQGGGPRASGPAGMGLAGVGRGPGTGWRPGRRQGTWPRLSCLLSSPPLPHPDCMVPHLLGERASKRRRALAWGQGWEQSACRKPVL